MENQKDKATEKDNKGERLQKLLANAGIASRRQAEQMILKGQVTVNGELVTALGTKVQPQDQVKVDGKLISAPTEAPVYYLLHKPLGVITSARDPQGRKTVIDLMQGVRQRVYPVGRLDYDTSGILVLTNDGELAHRLMHPSFGVDKTYRVGVKEKLSQAALEQLRKGVLLEDGKTAPAKVREISRGGEGLLFYLDITIHEGRNRQVRRMFTHIGYPVVTLQRIRFGPLQLDSGMKSGTFRALTGQEVQDLRRAVKLT